MSRLFQIYEDDLEALENALPDLHEAMADKTTPRLRVKLERVKQILSNVRWNYGPHREVEIDPEASGGAE